jgi:hypothetical protein
MRDLDYSHGRALVLLGAGLVFIPGPAPRVRSAELADTARQEWTK